MATQRATRTPSNSFCVSVHEKERIAILCIITSCVTIWQVQGNPYAHFGHQLIWIPSPDALPISEVPFGPISRFELALCSPRRQVGPQFLHMALVLIAHPIWMYWRIGIHALHLALSRCLTEIGQATPKASRGRLRHQNLGT
jgi:hypothetical protein